MDPSSPLTREVRDSFQPKIVQLYSNVFDLEIHDSEEEHLPSEGFWREFFLLKPEKQKFHDILAPLTASDLLRIRGQTRTYVQRSISEFKSGAKPQNENAIENLTAFLAAVLSKRYTNPSTDVIEVLAGLENVDKTMTDLVNGLESVISRSDVGPFRHKAIACAIAAVAGSYQTSLVTYFIHKDFFHGLMKFVQSTSETAPSALSLLGLLANYNKFESQNIYQSRMEDLVNEDIMEKLVDGFANTCGDIRDAYVAVQDDTPAQWSMSSTLSYVGLRALTPEAKKPAPPTEEEAKALFNQLPSPHAVIFLATYSFTLANQVFATHLISTDKDNDLESPLSAFLSATSYLAHHAFRSPRTETYALLSLFTIRLLTDDPILEKRLSSQDIKIDCRLARQRPPHLPLTSGPRTPTSIILDILTDTLSHNLRKRLSTPLYSTTLHTIHRILTTLSTTRTRLPHHYSYIWLSLLSLLRFLTTYATDLLTSTPLSTLQTTICTPLTSILTFSLLHGDNFLPDPPSYDDLFYKLLESADHLTKFRAAYDITHLPHTDKLRRATDALSSIASHYSSLLSSKKKSHTSPRQIQEVIGQGHETFGDVVDNLSATGSGGARAVGGGAEGEFGCTERFRESSWRSEVKRIVRSVVEDARVVVLR